MAEKNESSYELRDVAFGDLAFNASHSVMTSCLSRSANIFSKEASSAALFDKTVEYIAKLHAQE